MEYLNVNVPPGGSYPSGTYDWMRILAGAKGSQFNGIKMNDDLDMNGFSILNSGGGGGGGVSKLDQLTDVNTAGQADGKPLQWSSAPTDPAKPYEFKSINLSQLGDVEIPAPPSDNAQLVFKTATQKWEPSTTGPIPVALNELTDVSIPSAPPTQPSSRLLSLAFNPVATNPAKPYEMLPVFQSHQFKLKTAYIEPGVGEFCFQDPIFSATNFMRISYTSNALAFDNLWFQEEFATSEPRLMLVNSGEFTFRFKVVGITLKPTAPAYLTMELELVETVGNTILEDGTLCEFTSEPIAVNSAENVGTGLGVYDGEVDGVLQFNTLAAGTGLSIDRVVNDIFYSLDAELGDLKNVDVGTGLVSGQVLGYDGTNWTNVASGGAKEVLQFANLASFPATGVEDTIYVAEDTNLIYRFSEITPLPIPAIPPITPPTIDYGSLVPNYTVTDYATLVSAIGSASNGDVILLQDGTYVFPPTTTFTITKSLTFYGQSRAGVVLQTGGISSDPTTMWSLTQPDTRVGRMTFRHLTPNNISVECVINSSASGVVLDDLTIEYAEFGVIFSGQNFSITNSTLNYRDSTRPSNSVRAISPYGLIGEENFVENCVFGATFAGATGLRCIFCNSANPQSGTLWVRNNQGGSPTQSVQQFLFFEEINTGAFTPVVQNNTTYETSVFVGIYATTNNILDRLAQFMAVITDNNISGNHGAGLTKGVLALDGVGTLSAITNPSNKTIWVLNNTLRNTTAYRADYTRVVGNPDAPPTPASNLLQFGYKPAVFSNFDGALALGGYSYPQYVELSPSSGGYGGGLEPNGVGSAKPDKFTQGILNPPTLGSTLVTNNDLQWWIQTQRDDSPGGDQNVWVPITNDIVPTQDVVVGRTAQISSTGGVNVAIGNSVAITDAVGEVQNGSSVVIGPTSLSTRPHSVAIGSSAGCAGVVGSIGQHIAVGMLAQSRGDRTIAIGKSSYSGHVTDITADAVAIGTSSIAERSRAVAIGTSVEAGEDVVAIGSTISAKTATGTVAIGKSVALPVGFTGKCVAIGDSAVGNSDCVSVGALATANGLGSTAVGNNASTSTAQQSVAVGRGSSITNDDCVALGANALVRSNATLGVAIGSGAIAGDITSPSSHTISIGTATNALGSAGVAIGHGSQVGTNTIAIGNFTLMPNANFSVAVGNAIEMRGASQSGACSVGHQSIANDGSVALGYRAGFDNSGASSVFVGYDTASSNENSICIGRGAKIVSPETVQFCLGFSGVSPVTTINGTPCLPVKVAGTVYQGIPLAPPSGGGGGSRVVYQFACGDIQGGTFSTQNFTGGFNNIQIPHTANQVIVNPTPANFSLTTSGSPAGLALIQWLGPNSMLKLTARFVGWENSTDGLEVSWKETFRTNALVNTTRAVFNASGNNIYTGVEFSGYVQALTNDTFTISGAPTAGTVTLNVFYATLMIETLN